MIAPTLTHATFREASPAMKPEMVIDGLSYMQSMVNQTTQHLRILNTWVENMPGLIEENASERISRIDYQLHMEELQQSIDNLTEQITRLAQLQKSIQNCLTHSL